MKIAITVEIFDDPELCNKPGTLNECKWYQYGSGLDGSQCSLFRRSLEVKSTPMKIGETRTVGLGAFGTNRIIYKCSECEAHYELGDKIEEAKKYHEANDPQGSFILLREKKYGVKGATYYHKDGTKTWIPDSTDMK